MHEDPELGGPETLVTVSLEKELELEVLLGNLGDAWKVSRRWNYGALIHGSQASFYVFTFGALVCKHAHFNEVLSALKSADCAILEGTKESYRVVEDSTPTSVGPRVAWDTVSVRAKTPTIMAAVALLLGQSAALERYEHAVDELLTSAVDLPVSLVQSGRISRPTKKLLKWTGKAIAYRLELADHFFLVDRPEDTWNDPKVAALYDALFANLELRERHHAIKDKLDAVEQATDRVTGLWHAQTSNRLEWAIVLLIILEIVFAVTKII